MKKMGFYTPLLAAALALALLPDAAMAGNNSVSDVLCDVYNTITGAVGTLIAILGVISIGLIAMFGRIQISSVLVVMAGISLIFGAETILDNFNIGVGCGTAGTGVNLANNEFVGILSCIVSWFIGPMGKAIATVALMIIGIFATFGKTSWHQALLIAVGIGTMFGALSIIEVLGIPINGVRAEISDSCVFAGISTEVIFCNLIGMILGPVGKGIATTGLVILGLGAMFGKISWPMSMIFAIGVALLFGASGILESLGLGFDSGSGNALGCNAGTLDVKYGGNPSTGSPKGDGLDGLKDK